MNELQSAVVRRERAVEHLPDLKVLVDTIVQTCENGVIAHVDLDTLEWEPAPAVIDPMRLRAGVIAGEIVYNLRAALDYLAFVLAEHDSGTAQSGTQFPIEDTQQGFTARVDRYLKGVGEEHRAIIRQFQPYKGCEWTRLLRDLSNTDKHRELASVHIDFSATGYRTLADYSLEDEAEGPGEPDDMQVYLKGPAAVTLPDGPPLVETLQHLHEQVGLVLYLFSSEFPGG